MPCWICSSVRTGAVPVPEPMVAPVPVDHQVERGSVEERSRMLDLPAVGTFQHSQIGIVGNVLRCLAIAQARTQEAHQFAIIMFHNST